MWMRQPAVTFGRSWIFSRSAVHAAAPGCYGCSEQPGCGSNRADFKTSTFAYRCLWELWSAFCGIGRSQDRLLIRHFRMDATGAIIMLADYYGHVRGSTTSILMNIPGESASVVSCLEGYQMTRKGREGGSVHRSVGSGWGTWHCGPHVLALSRQRGGEVRLLRCSLSADRFHSDGIAWKGSFSGRA